MHRRLLLLALAVACALLAAVSAEAAPTSAQQPPPPPPPRPSPSATPPPPQPGEIVWAFASEPPLYDERVAVALELSMVDLRKITPSFRRMTPVPNGFVPATATGGVASQLLAAAGFGQRPPFIEVGQCNVWAASPPAGVQVAFPPDRAAAALAEQLQQALASLGVQIHPCATVPTPEKAHLLVWVYGGPMPMPVSRPVPTFLSSPGYVSPGSRPPLQQGSAGPAAPAPPKTGAGIGQGGGALPSRAAQVALLMAVLSAAAFTRGLVHEVRGVPDSITALGRTKR